MVRDLRAFAAARAASARAPALGVRRWASAICASLLAALISWTLASSAQALAPGISSTPSSTAPHYACPQGACQALIDPQPVTSAAGYELPAGGPLLEGSGELGGYGPQDIRSAYRIPASGGSTQSVALVEAYADPEAENELATYRERYGIEACTRANGCFKKVNQLGEEGNYPKNLGFGWGQETALDMDMVSAVCPHCSILLVEAREESFADLAAGVNTAVRLGATEVSNSYGRSENSEFCGTTGCTQYRSDYEHGRVPITVAGGDSGYGGKKGGELFPATVPGAIAVGATSLYKASNSRGWREEAWEGTGSGCSAFEPKPEWQTDKGCGAKRTTNDVAAVGGCKTPVSVFTKIVETEKGEWINECGTSVAAPIIASVLAHATAYTRSFGPETFYVDTEALFDVKTGSNGTCEPAYLCTAGSGYDGPTGLGTPDGVPYLLEPVLP